MESDYWYTRPLQRFNFCYEYWIPGIDTFTLSYSNNNEKTGDLCTLTGSLEKDN